MMAVALVLSSPNVFIHLLSVLLFQISLEIFHDVVCQQDNIHILVVLILVLEV
jgi:hypothetical protein